MSASATALGVAHPPNHRVAHPTSLPLALLCVSLACALLAGCTFQTARPQTAQARAEMGLAAQAWPEADALFRQSNRWLGGDAASSVDLGSGRTLWLFGDSFVADRVEGDRTRAHMIHNSVAIQRGHDPSRSKLHQYWQLDNGKPAAFLSWVQGEWLWPLHGVRIGDTVTIFCIRARADDNLLGFASAGWVALRTHGVDQSPSAWRMAPLSVPNFPAPLVGGVSVLRLSGWVYAYASGGPDEKDAFLMRWPEHVFVQGDLSAPEWFVQGGWLPQHALSTWPTPIIRGAAAEFSVSYHPTLGIVQVQTTGFPVGELTVRFADRPEGPFTPPRSVFRPPEAQIPGAMVYAGKAHAHLTGGELIATYVASGLNFQEVLQDPTRYYPRFVRLFPR